MNRIEKLKNDIYSFEELDTLEKNALKLGDEETLGLIAHSRMSKTVRGDKPEAKPEKSRGDGTKGRYKDRKKDQRTKQDRD